MKHFSFSHFIELTKIIDPLKRTFYENEGIRGCWSVAQLTHLPAEEQIRSFLVSERERTILELNEERALYGEKDILP